MVGGSQTAGFSTGRGPTYLGSLLVGVGGHMPGFPVAGGS